MTKIDEYIKYVTEVEDLKKSFRVLIDQNLAGEVSSSDLLKKSVQFHTELKKSQNDLQKLISSNPEFEDLSQNFSLPIFEKDKFTQSLQTLVKAHKTGKIDNETLVKAREILSKLVEVEIDDKRYMVKDNRTHYADMIIFNSKNQILFCKRNKDDDFEPGKYALPGGHVEPNEVSIQAATREVEEELYLTLDPKNVFDAGLYEDTKCVIHYYTTKIDENRTLILEERELQQYEWIDIDKVGDLDLILNLKDNFKNVIAIPTKLIQSEFDINGALLYGINSGDKSVGTGYPI